MPITQMFFYPEPYDPGFTIVKQFDTTKTGSQGDTASDDVGDLSVELEPGFFYRIFAVLNFETINGGGAPGVAVSWRDDANLTYLFVENRGSPFGSTASWPGGRNYHQEFLATPWWHLQTDTFPSNIFRPIWHGIVGCENAPTQFSPKWMFATVGASGATRFNAGSWMWVRKEGEM